jgi:23S rRNA (uracil1939-C5)-methyltransferase
MKGEAAVSALTRIGLDLSAADVRPPIGADGHDGSGGTYFYRNKMEFSFSAQRWLTDWEIATGEQMDTSFALGLHVPGRFDKVLDLQACYLQSEWSARLVNGVRQFAKEKGWNPWHAREHTGFLRILGVRTPAHTEDRMINLVTSAHDAERMATFEAFLRADFPEVTTLVNTVNSGTAQTSYGEAHVVFGPGTVTDHIGEYSFEIASNAFFQTNTVAAERLYAVAREFAHFQPTDVVYDLYCGAGTISLFVADAVERVVGVELVEEAVENARASAEANGVANCTFVAGDMLELFKPELIEAHGRPDVLILDPPRAGLHPKVTGQIAHLRPERIVYVSCNPLTQAKDLARLTESAAYTIEAVQPVDLFPHTHHVESVVGLRLA